ncbi:helix-turn-helix domain-containing protein [Denitrobaculum tricleocarpae]|uniref:Helix-turn-helix transcriptional regulator n=1 Tax=Denitrobaculum tricleocarpae TaxID=2591009 RepID=A0A545TX68_9PROT|nr:helix-turn-helix transcriptional regulator [Denitrobaculum tricleocarpae]
MSEKMQQAINEHVSRRIHARRVELGMTQKKVAEALGVSFQQFQKYEHAKNRLSAGRLYQLAEILDTPITYFFDDYQKQPAERPKLPESNIDTLASARLVRQFDSISSPALKQSVLNVIRALEPGR